MLASLFPTVAGPCDTQDYSSAVDRLVTDEMALFLFDTAYDGVGLTDAAFGHMGELVNRALERVQTCSCPTDTGCFRCIANPRSDDPSSKVATITLLNEVRTVMDSRSPELRETERDWDSLLIESGKLTCKCGHLQDVSAKFCSECGERMGATNG